MKATKIHTREESLEHLLRSKERQLHELQSRCDAAATILSNAILAKTPHFRREAIKAKNALTSTAPGLKLRYVTDPRGDLKLTVT